MLDINPHLHTNLTALTMIPDVLLHALYHRSDQASNLKLRGNLVAGKVVINNLECMYVDGSVLGIMYGILSCSSCSHGVRTTSINIGNSMIACCYIAYIYMNFIPHMHMQLVVRAFENSGNSDSRS